jgi:hypothetical protein
VLSILWAHLTDTALNRISPHPSGGTDCALPGLTQEPEAPLDQSITRMIISLSSPRRAPPATLTSFGDRVQSEALPMSRSTIPSVDFRITQSQFQSLASVLELEPLWSLRTIARFQFLHASVERTPFWVLTGCITKSKKAPAVCGLELCHVKDREILGLGMQ